MTSQVIWTVSMSWLFCHISGSILSEMFSGAGGLPSNPHDYGVDVSTQIHGRLSRNTFQGKRYFEMMDQCASAYSRRECESTENARIRMNRDQAATQHNYTTTGFKKVRAPPELWNPLLEFYTNNKHKASIEDWPRGNTYVNHWLSPSYMVSFEDTRLRGAGAALKRQIWSAAKPLLEEWTGKKLKETSLYGIRIYKDKAVLATHLDRLPLVTSAIINIDQDLNEPWPIEVYDHWGKAHNVTMEPGDMVFYESHTVLHGRPFPLNGSHYANVFVHFIPLDHDKMNDFDKVTGTSKGNIGGHEGSNHDLDDLAELSSTKGQTALHIAASAGDIETVRQILDRHTVDVNSADSNGWQPLHEAVRSGNLDIVKILVANGADVRSKTKGGGTALWWAKTTLDETHAVVHFFESIGAPEDEEK